MTTDLDCSVLIDGVEYSQYLLALERTENLAKPGVEISLEFSSAFPWGSIDPWDTLVVSEQGTLTLTGFVENIIPSREPKKVLVKGKDNYKRAVDFYTDQNFTTSEGQTIGYWTGFFCDLCGLGYSIDTSGSSSSGIPVNADIPFGFHSIDEILVTLCGIAQWLMFVTPDGVLHFKYIPRPLTGGDHTLTNVITWEQDTNDTDTRNRALIWGMTSGSLMGDEVLYSETREVAGVNGVRNMVYASPNIETVAQAQAVAAAALDQWARLDKVLAIDLIGDPARRCGQSATYSHTFLPGTPYLDTITDLKTTLSDGGYNQSLTAGRRTSRYPYFPVGTSGSSIIPTSGSVIWAVNGPSGYVQRMFFHLDYLYLIGQDTTSAFQKVYRVEKRHYTSGSLIWSRTFGTPSGPPGPLKKGTDIVVDNNFVYISDAGSSDIGAFVHILKLDKTSGSTIPHTFPVDGEFDNGLAGSFPWMTQDTATNGGLYFLTDGSNTQRRRVVKPTVADAWSDGEEHYNAIVSANDNYLVLNDTSNGRLMKIDKTSGSVIGTSANHGLDIRELTVSPNASNKCYSLSLTSGSVWQVTRWDIGGEDDPFINLNWTSDIPDIHVTSVPNAGFYKGITAVGFAAVAVNLGYLSEVFLGDDGSVGPVLTSGSLPTDIFLCNCVGGALDFLFKGGIKNNQWYAEGRHFSL